MAKLALFVVFLISSLAVGVLGQGGSSFVTIQAGDLGNITGLELYTSQGLRPFYTFHGLPYAESTAGEGRFKPSVLRERPLENTEGYNSFLALNPLVLCPQGGIFRSTKKNASEINLASVLQDGIWKWSESVDENISEQERVDKIKGLPEIDEDEATCLVLNVNTPHLPKGNPDDKKMPVILFIHGGSSTQIWGSLFTGFRFLEHDVVLVTINYRLGVLGALNLGTDGAGGNAAMYDAITALKWVKRNIHHWGGDPDSVTVYGHSAGGMMVSHLLLSPMAEGLIHGVIGASGSALAVWGTSVHPSINHHLQVCYYANCYDRQDGVPVEGIDYAEIEQCMREKDVDVLRRALSQYSDFHQNSGKGFGFDAKVPSVQSPSLTIERFLPEHPRDILAKKKQNNVPLIMGAMRHDGTFVFEDLYNKYILRHGLINNSTFLRNNLLPDLLESLQTTDKSGALAHSVGRTYMGDAYKTGDFWKMMPGLIDITSVWAFKAPAYELVEQHAKLNPNSYYYSFDHTGFWSTFDMGGSSDIPGGIAHIDDMMYTFQIFPFLSSYDRDVSNRMVEYFVNFAYHGDPNGVSEDVKWPPYHPFNHTYLSLGGREVSKIGYNCRDTWSNNGVEIEYK